MIFKLDWQERTLDAALALAFVDEDGMAAFLKKRQPHFTDS